MARDLSEIAADLYALRPDAFAGSRDDQVRQARADGKPELARELSKLRRPTQSAWLINVLWRDQREVMEQLFQLADELSRAQAQASGPELLRLTAQRRELEAALLRRARTLGEQAGVSVTATMEREAQETLAAALARADVADEVRSGRLVKPASYAGFGAFPSSVPVREVSAPIAPPHKGNVIELDKEVARRDSQRREEAERVARAEHRAEAERRVQEARAAVEAASGTLADGARAVELSQRREDAARKQVDLVREQLRRLEEEVAAAEQTALTAVQRRDQAEKRHADALRTLGQAEQVLEDTPAVS
jgi:hypothetical protein